MSSAKVDPQLGRVGPGDGAPADRQLDGIIGAPHLDHLVGEDRLPDTAADVGRAGPEHPSRR